MVAALTIPTLITNYQKQQTVSKLKEAYGIFSQAIRRSIADNGEVSGWGFDANNWNGAKMNDLVETHFAPYLKITRIFGPYQYQVYSLTQNKSTGFFITSRSNYMQLLNGMIFAVFSQSYDLKILVDLNGTQKPNTTGKDVFIFNMNQKTSGLETEGKHCRRNVILKDQGHCIDGDFIHYFYDIHCKVGNDRDRYAGGSCSGLIEKDGWKISKDYPW